MSPISSPLATPTRARIVPSALLAAAIAVGVALPTIARAQAPAPLAATASRGVELRPFAGGFLPTGDQRDVLKDAAAFGGQLGWRFHENLALTGTFTWAPSKDQTTAIASNALFTGREERVDAFGYDLGIEARRPLTLASSWTVAPYVGLGGGARSYHYRDVSGVGTQTTPVGYGSLGVDLAPATGPVGIRLEARDNVSGFKGLRGELPDRKARNDVQLSAGLSWRF